MLVIYINSHITWQKLFHGIDNVKIKNLERVRTVYFHALKNKITLRGSSFDVLHRSYSMKEWSLFIWYRLNIMLKEAAFKGYLYIFT